MERKNAIEREPLRGNVGAGKRNMLLNENPYGVGETKWNEKMLLNKNPYGVMGGAGKRNMLLNGNPYGVRHE